MRRRPRLRRRLSNTTITPTQPHRPCNSASLSTPQADESRSLPSTAVQGHWANCSPRSPSGDTRSPTATLLAPSSERPRAHHCPRCTRPRLWTTQPSAGTRFQTLLLPRRCIRTLPGALIRHPQAPLVVAQLCQHMVMCQF